MGRQAIDVDSLRYAMRKAGIKGRGTTRLAHKAGVSDVCVRDIMSGRVRFPRRDTVYRLSTALGVEPWDILEPDEDSLVPA